MGKCGAGLKQLSLGETSKITDAGLVELGQSTALAASLTELDLHECREVTSEGVAALTGLTALQTLDCNYMRYLAEEGIAALGTMPALTTLRLCGSKGVSAGVCPPPLLYPATTPGPGTSTTSCWPRARRRCRWP